MNYTASPVLLQRIVHLQALFKCLELVSFKRHSKLLKENAFLRWRLQQDSTRQEARTVDQIRLLMTTQEEPRSPIPRATDVSQSFEKTVQRLMGLLDDAESRGRIQQLRPLLEEEMK